MVERLEDLRNSVEWSEKMVSLKIKLSLKHEFGIERKNNLKSDKINLFNSLIKKSNSRIDALWDTDIIKKISTGQIKEWSCLDRSEFLPNGHLDIYCSPDITFKLQNKWHLVRIDFQGEKYPKYDDLESLSMVNWAKQKKYLPSLTDQFIVHTVKFIDGQWHHQRFTPNEDLLQQSKQLLEKDVEQMNKLVNRMGPLSDLSLVPLSSSVHYCKKCSCKSLCPAYGELEISKIEQKAIEYHNAKTMYELK